jgi:hypothetical protein
MDYRAFELANASCKPKHFAPPTALQKRLQHEAAYYQAMQPGSYSIWRHVLWIWNCFIGVPAVEDMNGNKTETS